MTPYEKAKQILTQLEAAAASATLKLPDQRFAQLGGQVVACEGLIVALAQMNPADGFDSTCGPIQAGDFIVTLARSCAVTYDDGGVDDPDEVARVSAEADADVSFLWDFAREYPYFALRTFSVSSTLLGGLMITTLALSVGID